MSFLELEVKEFLATQKSDLNALLIDVRESYEFEDFNIGGSNIPMGEILSRINDLKGTPSIYLYCKSGKRSKTVAYHLSKQLDSCKIVTMSGGIEAYKLLYD